MANQPSQNQEVVQQRAQKQQQTAIQPNQSISPGSQFIKTSQGIQKSQMRRSEDIGSVREEAPVKRQGDAAISEGASRLLNAAKAKKVAAQESQPKFNNFDYEKAYNTNYAAGSSDIKMDFSDIAKGPRFKVGETTYVAKNPDVSKGEVAIDPNDTALTEKILASVGIKKELDANNNASYVIGGQKLNSAQAFAAAFNIKLDDPSQQAATPEELIQGSIVGPTDVSGQSGLAASGLQSVADAQSGIESGLTDSQNNDISGINKFEQDTRNAIEGAGSAALTNTISDLLGDQDKQISDATSAISKLAYSEEGVKALTDLSTRPEELKKLLTAASTPAERMSIMQELSRLRDLGILGTQEQGLDEVDNWKQESDKMYMRLDESKNNFITTNRDLINSKLPNYAQGKIDEELTKISNAITTERTRINTEYSDFRTNIVKPVKDALGTIKTELTKLPAEQEAKARGGLISQALKIAGAESLPAEVANLPLKDIFSWAEKAWQQRILNDPTYLQNKADFDALSNKDSDLTNLLNELAAGSLESATSFDQLGLSPEQVTELANDPANDLNGDGKFDVTDLQNLSQVKQFELGGEISDLTINQGKASGLLNMASSSINQTLGLPAGKIYNNAQDVVAALQNDPAKVSQVLGNDTVNKITTEVNQRYFADGQSQFFDQNYPNFLKPGKNGSFSTLAGTNFNSLAEAKQAILSNPNLMNIKGDSSNAFKMNAAGDSRVTQAAPELAQTLAQQAGTKVWNDSTQNLNLAGGTNAELDRGGLGFEEYTSKLKGIDDKTAKELESKTKAVGAAKALKDTIAKLSKQAKDATGPKKKSILDTIKNLRSA